ncbi:hypothetical protein BFW38_15445 [Terasakiispira papahanaumokuakeensis]|uniref:Ubiquinone biosynthesis accessory factor UbiK n=1 Tax=Terasakiispira papahanaumokuakeensis TaxID=197479 RepID=A0A1E2VD20_9GAMM|nr:accessory factor UbiK family protein [Terasakiispira papahanaumokuakeensis]ODC04716.1 hypothetical protein BFW38_15445 [Terasakiispira papahanaumokuakeensis]
MIDQNWIRQNVEQLTDKLEAHGPRLPGRDTLRRLLQDSLSRLDMVSQDDYDRLLEIHQRTRQKVEALSQRVEALEARLNASDAASESVPASGERESE